MTSILRLLKRCVLPLAIAIMAWACQDEQERITNNPEAFLVFSTDTIRFDTIFTTVGSVTKRLKVFNPSKNAVMIENISLGGVSDSPYTLYINGKRGKTFDQHILLGKDSLLLLVEVEIDPFDDNLPFLVIDSVRFLTNSNLQDVKLITWGQDAFFIKKMRLPCDTIWSADKPIVLLDTVLVSPNCTLTIEEGTKIFANYSSALLVAGSLVVNGTAENQVLLTSSRLDIKNAYGQWGGIIFGEDSKNNNIDFCVIRNANYGIYIGTPDNDGEPDLYLSNTIIENAIVGMAAIGSDIHATNLLINNCAEFLIFNAAGGNYFYNHCTFANNLAGFYVARSNPAVVFSNYYKTTEETIVRDLSVQMHNSIVWGNLKNELHLNAAPESEFKVEINHSLLKTDNIIFNQNNNILNIEPRFKDFLNYNYRLDSLSPAINTGDIEYRIQFDLAGEERDQDPDMGAYEWIPKK